MKHKHWAITSDKFLTPEQINRFIDYLTQERDLSIARGKNPQAIREFYMFHGLLETGIHVAEFCDLVNSDSQKQRLLIRHGKGGKARTVLLTKKPAPLLQEWLVVKDRIGLSSDPKAPLFPSRTGGVYTTRAIQFLLKIILSKAGLPDSFSPHSWRHSNCTMLLAAGVDIARIRDNLGHHSISVVNTYAHATATLDHVDLYGGNTSEKNPYTKFRIEKGKVSTSNPVSLLVRRAKFSGGDGAANG